MKDLKFTQFLHEVENIQFETNTTATGTVTIQQTIRNDLRKEGVKALKADLEQFYGKEFDIVETKEGLVIVAENEPGDFTFSWEIKNTIKSIDYDPFIEAQKYEDAIAEAAAKKEAREQEEAEKQRRIAERRAQRIKEVEAEKAKYNK